MLLCVGARWCSLRFLVVIGELVISVTTVLPVNNKGSGIPSSPSVPCALSSDP